MRRGDNLRRDDILDAIEKIERWTSRSVVDDDLYRAGVAHELGVIGEAAAHLSRDFKARHDTVPWPKIVGLRNVLVHQYWDTAWAILEQIVTEDLPALKAALGPPGASVASLDADELLAEALERAPVGESARSRPPVPAAPGVGTPSTCGAWMPIARARCILRPGHFPACHHRSR